jgi:hypothetical protein
MAAEGPSLWGRMTEKRSARGQIISLTRRLLVVEEARPGSGRSGDVRVVELGGH